MACEEFLEQMQDAADEYERLGDEILQLQNQQIAQAGIMMMSYMLYMNCLANQGNRAASPVTAKSIPTLSDIKVFLKKAMRKLRLKKK